MAASEGLWAMHGEAPGAPGAPPTWTSGAKDAVTTVPGGRVWATVGRGIVTEVYWPTTGEPQVRDLGFIVAGPGWWHEVKRGAYTVSTPDAGTPLPTVEHTGDRYRLTLEVVPDPARDALLVRYRLEGDGVRLYPLLAPHIEVHPAAGADRDQATGADNRAWVSAPDALLASGPHRCLCLLAGAGFTRASAGCVGQSDGWQDFNRNGAMTWAYATAGPGNVALTAELDGQEGLLALAFAENADGAEILARGSLANGFEEARAGFVAGWQEWCAGLRLPPASPADPPELADAVLQSAVVMRAHEDDGFPGAFVASLAVPWGDARNDLGGYHLVWPRDAVETGLSLLALGKADEAGRLLEYLTATQQADGHWAQNFFPDGTPYWSGVQLDEAALPVVLAAKLHEAGHELRPASVDMVRKAVGFLARRGPLTDQDRWEENAGASPFTLAVVVAAMVAGSAFLEGAEQQYVLGLADSWNERIETWTYATGDPLCLQLGVAGHYVRIGPPPAAGGLRGFVDIRNRPGVSVPAVAVVGMEFLYLTRLGLRAAADDRIRDSLHVAEAVLGHDLPTGRAYYRYNDDGYGEGPGGTPFTGLGQGRPWPLLAGERGHHAVVAGDDALPQLAALLAMRGRGGLVPEQVWDDDDIPSLDLYRGRPTGSAMPLVWGHAELVSLAVARHTGRAANHVDAVDHRYGGAPPEAPAWYWRDQAPVDVLPRGRDLVVEAVEPFVLHFGHDGWRDPVDREAAPLGFGMWGVTVTGAESTPWSSIELTRHFASGWEGRDHPVQVSETPPMHLRGLEALVPT